MSARDHTSAPAGARAADDILSVPMPIDVLAEVIANTRLAPDYNVVALAAPEIARRAAPGQFLMVKPSAGLAPLLRRPFSVFEHLRDAKGGTTGVSILNKRVGVGTALLYDVRPGDRLPVPRTAGSAVRAGGPAGRGVDGGRRRGPGSVRDAGRGPRGARHGHDALLRRPVRARPVLRGLLRPAGRAARTHHRRRLAGRTRARHRAARPRARHARHRRDRDDLRVRPDRR